VQPVSRTPTLDCRNRGRRRIERTVPEEAAVAFTYDGGGYAVMMATPDDLEDFAVGFSLAEGIVASAAEIASIDVVEHATGIELRLWLAGNSRVAFAERRRRLAGPTGCGLCGIETLAEAMRPSPRIVTSATFSPAAIRRALGGLAPAQTLHHETRAAHAAAFADPSGGIAILREDVGRHNALDKLHGALARGGLDGRAGFVVITSRVSVEMVQKTAMLGVPLLVAISAPTALAIRTAETAGITLVAVARHDGFEVFTRPDRIDSEDFDVRVA
jgi:FdhD protein